MTIRIPSEIDDLISFFEQSPMFDIMEFVGDSDEDTIISYTFNNSDEQFFNITLGVLENSVLEKWTKASHPLLPNVIFFSKNQNLLLVQGSRFIVFPKTTFNSPNHRISRKD